MEQVVTECPYCLDQIEKPEESVRCETCGAMYHAECWSENEGCCVKDCASARRLIELDIPASDREAVVISREAAQTSMPHSTRKAWNPCLRCGRHLPANELYCRECKPEKEENQDARNTGPLLIMLVLLLLALGWVMLLVKAADDRQDVANPTKVETRIKR